MKLRAPASFGVSWKLLALSLVVGAFAFLAARILVVAIVVVCNLAFRQNLSFAEGFPIADVSPTLCFFIPILGGLILGLKARYLEQGIRGHGIPEIIERIYEHDGVIPYRMTWIRPLASAISIGTGGPYGAEGPIIGTGGAIGSLFAQVARLNRNERNTLLAAGAAAGVAAIFGTPMAGVFLAVELLLFEYKFTSFVPVAIAALVAFLFRSAVFGHGPLFSHVESVNLDLSRMVLVVAIGLVEGMAAAAVIYAVSKCENLYQKLPVHWMWWPALGAIAVGCAGVWNARSLGPGYDMLAELLRSQTLSPELAMLCAVKAVVWIIAVSSMTTGGTLAPLLIVGGGIGAAVSTFGGDHFTAVAGFGALLGMAAFFGAIAHAPLAGMFLVIEMTRSYEHLPLTMLVVVVAYLVVKLLVPHSIMTAGLHHRRSRNGVQNGFQSGRQIPDLHSQSSARHASNAAIASKKADK